MLQLKSAYRDGTTHIVMSPLEFMQRLVPRPRLHLSRFHGVLAPHATVRAAIVPGAAQKPSEPADEHARRGGAYGVGGTNVIVRKAANDWTIEAIVFGEDNTRLDGAVLRRWCRPRFRRNEQIAAGLRLRPPGVFHWKAAIAENGLH